MYAVKLPNEKFKLLQKMEYYEDPVKLYTPQHSNRKKAEANSLRLYKKLQKTSKIEEYEKEIAKAIDIGSLTKKCGYREGIL